MGLFWKIEEIIYYGIFRSVNSHLYMCMPENTCWRCTHLDCSCEHKQVFKAVLLHQPTHYKVVWALPILSSFLLHLSQRSHFCINMEQKYILKKITDFIKFKIISPPDNTTCSLFTLTCGYKGEDSWLLYFCESANAWNTAKLTSTSCPCILEVSQSPALGKLTLE